MDITFGIDQDNAIVMSNRGNIIRQGGSYSCLYNLKEALGILFTGYKGIKNKSNIYIKKATETRYYTTYIFGGMIKCPKDGNWHFEQISDMLFQMKFGGLQTGINYDRNNSVGITRFEFFDSILGIIRNYYDYELSEFGYKMLSHTIMAKHAMSKLKEMDDDYKNPSQWITTHTVRTLSAAINFNSPKGVKLALSNMTRRGYWNNTDIAKCTLDIWAKDNFIDSSLSDIFNKYHVKSELRKK